MRTVIRSNGKVYTIKDNVNRFLYPGEYNLIYDKAIYKQKHYIKCLINTGARINEVRNIKVSDCDLKNKRIILRVTKTKARKGETVGKPRIIPISSQFAKYLKKYFKDNKLDDYNFIGIPTTAAVNMGLKHVAQKAGILDYQDISAHTLRKTLEVWLMSLGVDSLKLVAHFGHSFNTAAVHYVSPDVLSHDERYMILRIIDDLYAPSSRGGWRI